MPSKLQHDANLVFLYTCLQKSDYKTIDFNAVGAATSLNAPAARMRFSRLKKAIESGSVTANSSPASTVVGGQAKQQKRKVSRPKVKKEEVVTTDKGGVDMELNPENGDASGTRMAMRPRFAKVKVETDMDDDGVPDDVAKYGSSGGSEYEGGEGDDDGGDDSEDIPLMKKRKASVSTANLNQSKKNKVVQRNANASHQSSNAAAFGDGPNSMNALYQPDNATAYVVDGSILGQGDLENQVHAYEAATLPPGAHPAPMILDHNNNNANAENFAPALPPIARGTEYSPVTANVIARSLHLQDALAIENPQAQSSVFNQFEHNGQIVFPPAVPPAPPHDRPPTSRYTLYPGLAPQGPEDSNPIGYRLPSITITDMEPYSPRNLLNPESIVASGKVEREVNADLFGPGSSAFQPMGDGNNNNNNGFGNEGPFVKAPPTPEY